jgi:uncharacterized membrane-anchored protein
MSFPKPPVVASSVALLAALSLAPAQGWAKDGRNHGGAGVIYEMAPMSADTSHEIIFEMAPLKPAGGATAQAPKPSRQVEPVIAAKPAAPAVAAKPAPAPVKEAAPAQSPAQPAPVAEAPKPAETQPAAEAPANAEAVARQAAPGEAPAAPLAEPPAAPVAEAPPIAAQIPVEPPPAAAPVEQPAVAEAPAIVEPAPIGPPVLSVNPPRKALVALKAPAIGLASHILSPQGDSSAPSLVPKLQSLAPEPAPTAAQAAAEPGAEEQPQDQAAAGAPVDPAAAQAETEARIAALLAEGLVGPVEIRIADRATMWLPAGRVFLPIDTARRLAQEAGLEWRPGIQGMVAPAGGALEWLAPVELLDDGYIKAGEADLLQPEKLLTAFQASLPEVNAQRARAGQPPVVLDGWLTAPTLDEKHRLAACVNVSTRNDPNGFDKFFNCEAWALGRQGAVKIGLASGGDGAARLKGEAAALADTIVFDRGKTYEEFDAASDKAAPYMIADLLTRDVAAKTAPAAPPVEEAQGGGWISSLFYPALFGVAALCLYVFLKRRREATKEDEAAPAPERIKTAPEPSRAREASVVAMEKPAAGPSPSLFARLLPTLHARLAKRAEPAPAIVASAGSQGPSNVGKPEAPRGGLMGKIAALRASGDAVAPPSNDAEEPASALKKLAARMRGGSEAPSPFEVNVSRVMRPVRGMGGAAPAVAASVAEPLVVEQDPFEKAEPRIGLIEPQLVEPKTAPAPASPPVMNAPGPRLAFDEDDLGLVEPGAPKGGDVPRNRRATDL